MATPIDLDILSELRQIAAFNDVGKEALAELALACTQRRVHAGQSLVDQGIRASRSSFSCAARRSSPAP